MDFHKILTSRLLVTDGAMGTYYREKYGETDERSREVYEALEMFRENKKL